MLSARGLMRPSSASAAAVPMYLIRGHFPQCVTVLVVDGRARNHASRNPSKMTTYSII